MKTNRKEIIGNDFFSIGSFIYYKTRAEMCYKWFQLLLRVIGYRPISIVAGGSPDDRRHSMQQL